MSNSNTLLMTEGNIYKIIIRFAIPIFISNVFQQLYNTVDSAVVGAIEGTEAIASVGTTAPIINLLVGLFLGVATGCSAVIARHFGSKNEKRLEDCVHTGIAVGLVGGIILMIIGIIGAKWLLILIKSPNDTLDLSTLYLRIYFIGMIPMILYNMGAGILQGVGDSKRPLIYLSIGGVANIILDLLFVAVFRWSVAGVAIATVLAQLVSTTLVLYKLLHTNDVYKLSLKQIKFHKTELKDILKFGIPAGLQSAFFAISNLLIQGFINDFGSKVMAGQTAYSKIDGFLYMPTSAFGITTMTFVSQNISVNNIKRAKKGTNIALLLSVLTTLALVVIVLIVGKPLIALFTKGDETAIKYGVIMMYCMAPFTVIYAFIEVFSGFVKAAGATTEAMVITGSTICVFRVVYLLFMFYALGIKSIYVIFSAYPVSWILCLIVYLIYYLSNGWQKYLFKHKPN